MDNWCYASAQRERWFPRGVMLLIALGVVAKFCIWIVAMVGALVLGAALGWLMWRATKRVDARHAAREGLGGRADPQHAWILATTTAAPTPTTRPN